jgi:uncharacterized Zn finger protein (UPF0148 family)
MAHGMTSRREADALDYGFSMIRNGALAGRWKIACSRCGAEVTHGWDQRISPEMMARNLKKQGWQVSHKPPLCPACQKKEKTVVTAQAGPDPKLARRIYQKLDEVFDEAKRRYAASWSDDKVAKDLGVSVELVAGIRDEAYGKLAEDPAIAALRDDIELFKMQFDEAMKTLRAEMEGCAGVLGTRLEALPGAHRKAAG